MPALGFVPFGDGAEMRIVKTCGGFSADFAAADGGIQFAVKGDNGLFELEAEGGLRPSKTEALRLFWLWHSPR